MNLAQSRRDSPHPDPFLPLRGLTGATMEQMSRLNLMVASPPASGWGEGLARTLAALPLDFHWPATARQALELVVSGDMHVAVVDDQLPDARGIEALRRFRRLGAKIPCVLVCRRCDARLLREALDWGAYSVVDFERQAALLPPLVLQAVRRAYRLDWRLPKELN